MSTSDRLPDRVVALPKRPGGTAHNLPAQLTSLIGRERDLEDGAGERCRPRGC